MQLKKYRKQEQCFIVEGEKSVMEVLHSGYTVLTLVATPGFVERNRKALDRFKGELLVVSDRQLQGLGAYESNDAAVAVVKMGATNAPELMPGNFYLVLDDVRDPGNLGTILRIADWYGMTEVIASSETTDVYNSKVIAASMGSFTRVNLYYTDLVEFLRKVTLPVIGTFLSGDSIHDADGVTGGLVVIGNEASGISKEVEALVTRRFTIPRYGKAESLNAAVAAAIVCDNLMRQKK